MVKEKHSVLHDQVAEQTVSFCDLMSFGELEKNQGALVRKSNKNSNSTSPFVCIPQLTPDNKPIDLLQVPIGFCIGLQCSVWGLERDREGFETQDLCGFKIQPFLKQLPSKYSEMTEIRSPTQAGNRVAAKSHSKWKYTFKRERIFPLIALCFS